MSDGFNNFFDGLCKVALGVGYGLKLSSLEDQILDLIPGQTSKALASKLLQEYRSVLEEVHNN